MNTTLFFLSRLSMTIFSMALGYLLSTEIAIFSGVADPERSRTAIAVCVVSLGAWGIFRALLIRRQQRAGK